MLLTIQPNIRKPIYEQLILELKQGVIRGELKPGERLPGSRILAADLGINMHTVNKVYKQMEQEQVFLKSRGGFIVNTQRLTGFTSDAKKDFQTKLYEIIVEKELYQISDQEFEELVADTKNELRR